MDTNLYSHIFFPYASAAIQRVRGDGSRFAYYTTAETAIQILRNKEIWMRNTQTMNDYMEVRHGVNCLSEVFQSAAWQLLESAIDGCFESVSREISSLFNAWIPGFLRDTFVTCVSEHTADEDPYGRLSMWRAYGGQAGVALILNGEVMLRESDALPAYSSPVAYIESDELAEQLIIVATRIKENLEYVRRLGRDQLKDTIFNLLRFGAVCTKHPAFREEREWRIVTSPAIASSPLLPQCVETIRGVPQLVLKIKLVDHPERGFYGITPNDLLDRVLIGPCEHSAVISRALREVMNEIGIEEPGKIIYDTSIPLRQSER